VGEHVHVARDVKIRRARGEESAFALDQMNARKNADYRRLEAMEDAAGFGPGRAPNDMTFRIDAEVTEYRGKN